MALVVEDGTGISNAEAYATETEADTYHTAHGAPAAWTASSTAEKEDALRIAGEYLQVVYGGLWKGQKNNTDVNQSMDWPRKNVIVNGYLLPASGAGAIPTDLKNANIILANKHREAVTATTPTSLLPDESNSGHERSRSVRVGPITKTVSYATANPPHKRFRIVQLMLRRYLTQTTLISRG
jgi:hypothetical protein